MRLVLVLVACSSCIYASADTDGNWSSLTEPCIPLGDTHVLLTTEYSVPYMLAGDTLLYSPGETIRQLSLVTGSDEIIMRSDGVSEFGAIGNDLVYYESNGVPNERRPIDVIIDRGTLAISRYQRISPRPGDNATGLMTTPHGIYWWTTSDEHPEIAEWRWDPETSSVEPFPMDRGTITRMDDTSFFYFDLMSRLTVRPQAGGPPTVLAEMPPTMPPAQPIGVDGDEVFYTINHDTDETTPDLVARGPDGIERVLVANRHITTGAIDPTYVYFAEDAEAGHRQDLFRVPRAGGPIETVFEGEDNSTVFDVVTDRCNVYWQQFTIDGGHIYGREITQ